MFRRSGVDLIKAAEIVGVYSDSELKDAKITELEKVIREKFIPMEKAMREKDGEIQQLQEQLKWLEPLPSLPPDRKHKHQDSLT